MTSGRQIGYAVVVMGVFMILLFTPTSSSGQVISDQSLGPVREIPLNEGVIVMPEETLPQEVDQRFEHFMQIPEKSSETADSLLIKTPDQLDLENARESDLRSAVSF